MGNVISTSEMNDFAGRTAIVTGGASGIGRATAVALARRGARVIVGDYRPRPENDAALPCL